MNIVNGLLANVNLHGEEFHNSAVIMKFKFLKSPNIGLAVCTNVKVLEFKTSHKSDKGKRCKYKRNITI